MINRLGLVLECAREGADEKVLGCLIRRLAPNTVVPPSACMASKENLFNNGSDAAKNLLIADKCDRVFIVWDLTPEWKDQEQLLTCAQECILLATKLDAIGIRDKVDLICIVEMLETWIIADDRAVSEYLSRPAHPFKFHRVKHPEAHADPKALLMDHFDQTFRRTYRDHTDAVRIIQKCPDTTRLVRVSSFSRFVEKLTDNAATVFSHCGNICNDLARSGLFQPVAQAAAPLPVAVAVAQRRKARPKR